MSEWRPELVKRLDGLGLRPESEAAIVEELAQHLDDRVRELVADGATPDAAKAAALADLDAPRELSRQLAQVVVRPPLRLPPPGQPSRDRWLSALWQDIRSAVRTLRLQPTFTATVLLALALGIGPTTAILGVANWLLWKPVPGVADGGRLASVEFGTTVSTGMRMNGVNIVSVSALNLDDLKADMRSLSGLAWAQESTAAVIAGLSLPQVLGLSAVTGDFFEVLGIRMAAGRALTLAEDRAAAFVTVISEGLATTAFGSPAAAIGQRLVINRRPFQVVGVAARGFRGISNTSRVDLWMASGAYMVRDGSPPDWSVARGQGFYSQFVGRLAPHATSADAERELTGLARKLASSYPQDNGAFAAATAYVVPGLNTPRIQRPATQGRVNILLAIGGVLLLLGCANAANMLIARAIRREHEIAIRKALGASRGRLLQIQFVESCVLSTAGAVLGLGLAVLLKQIMQQRLFPPVAGMSMDGVPIDTTVLAATMGTALAVGVVAGLAPAWLVSGSRLGGALTRGGGGRNVSRAPRLRSALAAAQLALSLILLVGALLLGATLRNLRGIDIGFDPAQLTLLHANLDDQGYSPAAAVAFQRDLLTALNVPDRVTATVSFRAPFGANRITRVLGPDGREIRAVSNGIAHNYFSVLGTPIVRGRGFTADEVFSAAPANGAPAVINETLARQLFGDADPLGRIVRTPPTSSTPAGEQLVVIGLTRDARWRGLTAPPDPFLYLPLGRFDLSSATILMRSARPAEALIPDARAAATRLDPAMPLMSGGQMADALEREIRNQQLFGTMLAWLSTLAMVLAAVGLHGLVAQTTVERAREFGIRMAIGAGRGNIARLVGRYVLTITIVGTVAGIALATFGSRLLESMLFGVAAVDPTTYALAVAVLAATVGAAAAWPVFRATQVQPVDVLRTE